MRESTQIRNKIRVIQIPFFRVFIPLAMLFKVARLLICHRNSDNSISAKENYKQNFRVIVESYHLGEGTCNSRGKVST